MPVKKKKPQTKPKKIMKRKPSVSKETVGVEEATVTPVQPIVEMEQHSPSINPISTTVPPPIENPSTNVSSSTETQSPPNVKSELSQVKSSSTIPLDSANQISSDYHKKVDIPERKDGLIIIILSIVLVVSIVFFGGVVFYNTNIYKNKLNAKPTEDVNLTSTPEVKVSPTKAVVEVDLSAYSIKVLNGSGIAGEAGRIRDVLKSQEFSVSSVGNAQGYDFEETTIQHKKEVSKAYLEKLKEVLSKEKTVKISKEQLESSDDDVVVTVGSLKSSK